MSAEDANSEQGTINSEEEALQSRTFVQLWLEKINKQWSDKKEKRWREAAADAIALYEDGDDSESASGTALSTTTAANLYHSNIETLLPALFNSTPVPDFRPKYNSHDPIARKAAEVLEQAVATNIDSYDYDDAIEEVVKMAILPGSGTARIRYEPKIGQSVDPEDNQPFDSIENEQVLSEPVQHDRIIYGPTRRWPPPWIAFPHDLSHREINKLLEGNKSKEDILKRLRFGEADEIARKSLERERENFKGLMKTIPSYEVWDMESRKIFFITEQIKDQPLKVSEDLFGFPSFYPVPRPLQQIRRLGSMVPVCPYTIYKPLLEEFDRINDRIRKLISQLRVRGLVDPQVEPDFSALANADDGQYFPASSEKAADTWRKNGGVKLEDLIAHWPLEPTIAALQQLYAQREALKQLVYEVTGLSDILRGGSSSTANGGAKTATEQQIKNQWGTQRIQRLQREVARFNRDIIQMKAHVIGKLFQWQSIKEQGQLDLRTEFGDKAKLAIAELEKQSAPQPGVQAIGANGGPPMAEEGVPPPAAPSPQAAPAIPPEQLQAMAAQMMQEAEQAAAATEQAIQELLKSKAATLCRLDLESDSTIKNDMARNQDQMNAFLGFTGAYVTALVGVAQAMPMMLPAFVTIYAEFCRRFKFGRQGMEAVDSLTDLAKKQVAAGIPGQIDPAAEQASKEREMQATKEQAEAEAALARDQMAHEAAGREHEGSVLAANQMHEATMSSLQSEDARSMAEQEAANAEADRQHEAFLKSHDQLMAALEMQSAGMTAEQQMAIEQLKQVGEHMRSSASAAADARKASFTQQADERKMQMAEGADKRKLQLVQTQAKAKAATAKKVSR